MPLPQEAVSLLVPRPQDARADGSPWLPRAGLPVHLQADGAVARHATLRLREGLAEHGVALGGSTDEPGGVRLSAGVAGLPAEGYRLSVGADGVAVDASDERGLAHGVSTLLQWIAVAGRRGGASLEVPGLAVEDHPDFAERGVMLDVARDKVPRMDTLQALIDRLAGWKINQLQLYMEHTFAYRGHEEVWRDASPFTPGEIRALDAFCAERGIELVPNQNSFGHFHRWLVHERYRPLAECPEGLEHPFSLDVEPFSLCAVDPRVPELLADLYDQLLPCFTSRRFNVGLDESFDLGRCRSAGACEERGRHRVYLEFLQTVHRLVTERGHRMQFWGDIVLEEPSILPELPRDATALEWGYEAGHPFEEHGRHFAAADLEHHVCPGTSSWASLTGRTTNAVANLAEAAAAGRSHGAAGYLVTDWGDYGHLQPLPVSYPGLLAGAAAAWNAAAPLSRSELPPLLDRHVFHDEAGAAGAVTADLGDTYLAAGGNNKNATALFFLLLKPERRMDEYRSKTLTREGLEAARAHLADAMAPLTQARMARSDAGQLEAELRWSADATDYACRLGLARLEAGRDRPVEALPAEDRRRLARELDDLLERRRGLWLERNRRGGLEHALSFLAALRQKLRVG
ncbi:MAG TPA: glycoside hydrolase family 20 zincin-like fold domain-containing protein [Thermoanaerobaculia bacterium]|nr:glycoside hydrolase family 20 zincin-like fold domain-containing protein [Thermoanaerobaculia bacterium]